MSPEPPVGGKEETVSQDRPRTLLVGTDLTEVADTVLRAAGAVAAHTGAEIHVVHAVEGGPRGADDPDLRETARRALEAQLARCLPPGVKAAGVALRPGPPYRAIQALAEELHPDLLVMGPHGGSRLADRALGSTADRVLRTVHVPCLVVRGDLRLPVRALGVPVDFSDPSREALRLAFRWAGGLVGEEGRDGPEVRLLHVGWPVTQVDVPDHEEAVLRPGLAREVEEAAAATGARASADAEVLWDNLPGQRICRWARSREVDLLFVGTHGRSGLPRFLLGSMAAAVARESPCSVVLVPPAVAAADRPARAPALDRILVATDFSLEAQEAGAWLASHLAPEAELVLAHAAEVPYPPSFLRGGLPPREELTATALEGAERRLEAAARSLPRAPAERVVREGRPAETLAGLARELGADLVAVGSHGRRGGLWTGLGSTAEGLLVRSPVPVLVTRGVEGEWPRHLLVPMDDSLDARHALAWASFLAQRLEARITLLHVVSSALVGGVRRVSSESVVRTLEESLRSGVETWLTEVAEGVPLPRERVETVVEMGVPELQILAAAARLRGDLIVMGSRGSGGGRAVGLGGLARAVVRHGTGPVLVVPTQRP